MSDKVNENEQEQEQQEHSEESARELIKSRIVSKLQDIKSFPQFVLETMRKLNDPTSNVADVAKSLSRDEGLVLRVLKLANSAAYGATRNISNIQDVALLGYKAVSNIILAASVYSAMDKGLSGYALDRGELWRHSLMVAYVSRHIAQKLGGHVSADDAYVGGLLHDIGKVVLNDYVRFGYGIIVKMVEEQSIPFTEAEVQVLGFDHAMIGDLLTEKWGLPEGYRCAVAYHHRPNDLPESKKIHQPLLDIVSISNSLCLMLGIGIGADGLQGYLYPEPLERLGITDFEDLMADVIDFANEVSRDASFTSGM